MSQPLTLGVDFGSTGLRVAYLGDDGQPVVLPDRSGGFRPGIACERRSGSRGGVSFSCPKSRLGTAAASPVNGSPSPAAEAVTRAFRAVKTRVEEHTARRVSEAVVTVPALYSASQRAALRAAVLAAGFVDAHLLNDSVAAVLAWRGQSEEAATVLVYAMGYAGFELGLVRAARGHYRALGYEGGWSPAGWTFDRLLLDSLLGFLGEQRWQLDTTGWDDSRWLQMQAITERVKERLSAEERVAFPVLLATPEGHPLVSLSLGRAGFEEAVRPFLRRTLDQVVSLLDQASLSQAQVDAVLMVGGSTRIPILRTLVAGALDREPVVLDGEALARGAALFTAQVGSRPVPVGVEQERPRGDGGDGEIPADLTALRAALTVADEPLPQAADDRLVLVASEAPAASPAGLELLLPAIHLLEQNRTAEARALLEDLIREARTLLARLDPAGLKPSASPGAILARRALVRARQLLKKGQYEEAVRESHLAWQQDRDSPDTFEQMIDVHCQAATANGTPESYADAQRWLNCAITHDESNTRVRHLLAERHYLHARQQSEQGKRKQALETLENCFAWNPEHEGARELHASLTRR